jgi:hypothetical protein
LIITITIITITIITIITTKMDISNYAINEIIWIEFLENSSNIVEGPNMGNIFEDVSDLFPKYFKNNTYYNAKSVAKKQKK